MATGKEKNDVKILLEVAEEKEEVHQSLSFKILMMLCRN